MCHFKRSYLFPIIALLSFYCPQLLHSQTAPSIDWQKSYGGLDTIKYMLAGVPGNSLISTDDGGYLFSATAAANGGDITGFHSAIATDDIWLVKVNSSGVIQWQKCLGGTNMEYGYCIIQTSDGGYICCGMTSSIDGDPPLAINPANPTDGWIIKLDSFGAVQWQKRVGGKDLDELFSIKQTFDGGYIAAGWTFSKDEDLFSHGKGDAFVIKLNSKGDIEWKHCYGGSMNERAWSILQIPDGGYIFTGSAASSDGNVSGNHSFGHSDLWVVQINSQGDVVWQKCYGGSINEDGLCIIPSFGGGYAIAGYTVSSDFDVTGFHTSSTGGDAWILKIDTIGTLEWEQCLGGSSEDKTASIIQTSDSGYFFTGYTYSNDGDVTTLYEKGPDTWVCKLSSKGKIQWQKTLGGSNQDYGNCSIQTSENGYLVYSTTLSTDADVSGNKLGRKAWLAKLNPSSNNVETAFTSSGFKYPYPNPSSVEVNMLVFSSMPIKEIQFYNIIGNQYYPEYRIEGNTAIIDVHTLPNGLYISQINYISGDKTVQETRKFIISN
jgi:hypothetical protein